MDTKQGASTTDADVIVTQEYVEPKFYTRIPNIIYHLKLSPYAVILYNVLKQTAGDRGLSFKSTTTLAEQCNMSVGKVSECKRVLARSFPSLGNKPLISIAEKERPGGGKPYHEITIVNIWPENVAYFEQANKPSSPHEHASSPREHASSPREFNKITLEEKPTEERGSPFSEELQGRDFWGLATLTAQTQETIEPGAAIAEHCAALLGIPVPEWKYRENWLEPALVMYREGRAAGLDVGGVKEVLSAIFAENEWMGGKNGRRTVTTAGGFYNTFHGAVVDLGEARRQDQLRDQERAHNQERVRASLAAAGVTR